MRKFKKNMLNTFSSQSRRAVGPEFVQASLTVTLNGNSWVATICHKLEDLNGLLIVISFRDPLLVQLPCIKFP